MGAKKRGKYKGYNKKYYDNNFKTTQYHRADNAEQTFLSKLYLGSLMYQNVLEESKNHFIGERIAFKKGEYPERTEDVGGLVVGIYPHFLLLDCGNYKTTVPYEDLIIGRNRNSGGSN